VKTINVTHVRRYVESPEAHILVATLKHRCFFDVVPIYTQSNNGRTIFYKRVHAAEVDIDHAIKQLTIASKDRGTVGKRSRDNHASKLDVLYKIREDRIKYGDRIPDSSDIWNDLFTGAELARTRRFAPARERIVLSKRLRRIEFLKRWKATYGR